MMKKGRLLNSELSYEIARIGHTSYITVCDAGLPIPKQTRRIDLALEKSIPGFINTLDVILDEMQVEEAVIAEEMKASNPAVYRDLLDTFKKHGISPRLVEVPHKVFKEMTKDSEAIVRTGECTPYANVIIRSGVVF